MQASPQKNNGKKIGDYFLIKEIGKGKFGSVWYSQYADKNKPRTVFAIKEMQNVDKIKIDKILQFRRREINNLIEINHQNIIQLISIFQNSNSCYLVLEYAEGGTLKQFQQRCGGRLSEDQALYFMVQLAEGLKALYDNNILHRFLDTENILLSDTSSKPILKICDFILSKSIEDEGQGCTKFGGQPYMAFEII